jgi:CTP:molybdopterin cytidylyltransferase MocA
MKKTKSKGSSSLRAAVPRVAVAIMAAGKGTRLKSQLPKVLHEVGGKPLLEHVVRAAVHVVPANDVYVIIGHEAERVRAVTAHTASTLCCKPSSGELDMRSWWRVKPWRDTTT